MNEIAHVRVRAVMAPFATARIDRQEDDARLGAPIVLSNPSRLRAVDDGARKGAFPKQSAHSTACFPTDRKASG